MDEAILAWNRVLGLDPCYRGLSTGVHPVVGYAGLNSYPINTIGFIGKQVLFMVNQRITEIAGAAVAAWG